LTQVDLAKVYNAFDTNAVAVLRLYQAVRDLLDKSPSGGPKWMTLGSAAGSTAIIEQFGTAWFAPYAISKAAVHWITSCVSPVLIFFLLFLLFWFFALQGGQKLTSRD
jgi:short-subunit dehydrogenase